MSAYKVFILSRRKKTGRNFRFPLSGGGVSQLVVVNDHVGLDGIGLKRMSRLYRLLEYPLSFGERDAIQALTVQHALHDQIEDRHGGILRVFHAVAFGLSRRGARRMGESNHLAFR